MYQDQYGETPYEDRTVPQHATPTLYPPTPRKMPWLALTAITAGFLGLALGAASLTLFLSFKSTTAAQISQLRQELSQAQSTLDKVQSGDASSYDALNTKISSIDGIVSILAPYTTACSQALVNQSGGTGLYYYPCSAQRP